MNDDLLRTKWALTDALLGCPKFGTKSGRDDVLSNVQAVRDRANRKDDDRSDALSIVQACIDLPGGIDKLIDALAFFERETKHWPEVLQAADELKAQLDALQKPQPKIEPISSLREQNLQSNEPKFALVIGVSRYANGVGAGLKLAPEQFTHLQCAASDAAALRDFLDKNAHYDVDALIDEEATLAGIMRGLDELRKKCCAPGVSNPTALVYFAGHGAQDDGRSYLVPYDARRDRLFATALWSRTLDCALDELRTDRLALFLDACHAEAIGMPDQRSAEALRFDPNSIVRPSGRFVVASCMAGQKSYEEAEVGHGVFTRHLLELLRCEDPQALPEEIELLALYSALKNKVTSTVKKRFNNAQQEPFASFQKKTQVVLAINEPLRRRLREQRLKYVDACAVILQESSHPRAIKVVAVLQAYCATGLRPLAFNEFFKLFDAVARDTDPNVKTDLEYDCTLLLRTFDTAAEKVARQGHKSQYRPCRSSGQVRPHRPRIARLSHGRLSRRRSPAKRKRFHPTPCSRASKSGVSMRPTRLTCSRKSSPTTSSSVKREKYCSC